jgi:Tol biopolymer transport system component
LGEIGDSIQLLDVATRAVRPIRIAGQRPRWSPAGDQLAFIKAQSIWVVRPDGAGLRRITMSGRQYLTGQTWSPDGRWLRAQTTTGAFATSDWVAVIINVATGVELPLAFTYGWSGDFTVPAAPVWRPGS